MPALTIAFALLLSAETQNITQEAHATAASSTEPSHEDPAEPSEHPELVALALAGAVFSTSLSVSTLSYGIAARVAYETSAVLEWLALATALSLLTTGLVTGVAVLATTGWEAGVVAAVVAPAIVVTVVQAVPFATVVGFVAGFVVGNLAWSLSQGEEADVPAVDASMKGGFFGAWVAIGALVALPVAINAGVMTLGFTILGDQLEVLAE